MKRNCATFFLVAVIVLLAFSEGTAQLRKQDPHNRKILLKGLKSPDENIRAESAEKLALITDPVSFKPLLNTAVTDNSLKVRLSAIYALGRLKDRRAVPFLLRAIKNRPLMPAAAMALGRIVDERGIEPIVDNMKFWEGCGIALEYFGEKANLPLIKALKATDDRTRLMAVKLLARTRPEGASAVLEPLRNDKNLRVREAAVKALSEMAGKIK